MRMNKVKNEIDFQDGNASHMISATFSILLLDSLDTGTKYNVWICKYLTLQLQKLVLIYNANNHDVLVCKLQLCTH